MYRMTRQAFVSPVRALDTRSPFVRLRELLADIAPGKPAISMAVGEPQHPIPDFVGPIVAAHVAEFGRYPMNKGLDAFGEAVAKWLNRRYALERPVDPATEVLVLSGTREGLFLAALAAKRWVKPRPGRPAVLIPNPFYAAYAAGAIAADCEPVYLPATSATGFLPDLDALDENLLARTVAFFLASPSNPQGAVADRAYLSRLAALARRFGFLVFCDECYCEIYSDHAPPGRCQRVDPARVDPVDLRARGEAVDEQDRLAAIARPGGRVDEGDADAIGGKLLHRRRPIVPARRLSAHAPHALHIARSRPREIATGIDPHTRPREASR